MASKRKFKLASEQLSIRDVLEKYGHCLPVIIQVIHGYYYGESDLTFSNGETMRIHTSLKQRRVVTRDSNGRHYSIPLDYPFRFKVVENSAEDEKEQSLTEIVADNSLPVRIELCLPPTGYSLHIGQSNKQLETVGALCLIDTYEETYLVANSIAEDGYIRSVPVYLKNVIVAEVCGIVGRSLRTFNRFKRDINDIAVILRYDGVGGNQDIAVYSDSTSTEDILTNFTEPEYFIKHRLTKKSHYRQAKAKTASMAHSLTPWRKQGDHQRSRTLSLEEWTLMKPPTLPPRPRRKSCPNTNASSQVG